MTLQQFCIMHQGCTAAAAGVRPSAHRLPFTATRSRAASARPSLLASDATARSACRPAAFAPIIKQAGFIGRKPFSCNARFAVQQTHASSGKQGQQAIDDEDTPKVATEFITQALFNYFSCSAVAIATVVGGSNSALVTALMIAAHMVLVPLIAYVGAPASGAHFNPIITFAFMITGIQRVKTGIQYIIAQCVGGVLGAYAMFNLLPIEDQVAGLAGLHTIPPDHTVTQAFFGEVFASFFFIWVIMGLVKSKKGWGQFGPFAIALGITFNMWITGPISSNCINPARALGPAVVTGVWTHHWVWWTAPFVGAAIAAKLYAKYVMPKDQLKELRDEVQAASA